MPPHPRSLIAFGEILWDCLPSGIFLGGAPLNVAYHSRKLGFASAVWSALGDDFLGQEARERMEDIGVDTRFVQPAAWDRIPAPERTVRDAIGADVLVYGSLAMREPANRATLEGVLAETRALKVCDVNLRPSFEDLEYARKLVGLADVVKLNEDEIGILGGEAFSFEDPAPAFAALRRVAPVGQICVTAGEQGACFEDNGRIITARTPDVQVSDTVGAGDAFAAALIAGLVAQRETGAPVPVNFLDRPSRLGAYVASRSGAQPDYDPAEVLG